MFPIVLLHVGVRMHKVQHYSFFLIYVLGTSRQMVVHIPKFPISNDFEIQTGDLYITC